jgi:hypothetical protein
LLHEYAAPELVRIPIVVIDRLIQAGTFIRVEPQVGDDWPIDLPSCPKPAVGLISESELEVVDPRCRECAFCEIPDLMTLGGGPCR